MNFACGRVRRQHETQETHIEYRACGVHGCDDSDACRFRIRGAATTEASKARGGRSSRRITVRRVIRSRPLAGQFTFHAGRHDGGIWNWPWFESSPAESRAWGLAAPARLAGGLVRLHVLSLQRERRPARVAENHGETWTSDRGGDTFATRSVIEVLDLNDAVIGGGCATAAGTRFE